MTNTIKMVIELQSTGIAVTLESIDVMLNKEINAEVTHTLHLVESRILFAIRELEQKNIDKDVSA